MKQTFFKENFNYFSVWYATYNIVIYLGEMS